jgi:hypothetical protein
MLKDTVTLGFKSLYPLGIRSICKTLYDFDKPSHADNYISYFVDLFSEHLNLSPYTCDVKRATAQKCFLLGYKSSVQHTF